MKIQSSEYPSKFFKHQNKIYINDLSTVAEETKEETLIYSYEHYPLEVSDRIDLAQYVESNYTLLLNKSKEIYEQRQLEKAMMPSNEEIEKAQRDIETINLLVELGVL